MGFYEPTMSVDMSVMGAILAVFAVFALISCVVGIVMYVLEAVGTYTIAKRRGIRHAWLAWIPLGSYWIAGSISDQYRYVAKGQVTNRRKIMLILGIVSLVVSALGAVTSVNSLIQTLQALYMEDMDYLMEAVGSGTGSSLLSLISSGVSIALLVFSYMSLYDLYSSCNPKNNVLFLVLGIFFSFLRPIFVFVCRNKDLGMPQAAPASDPYIPQQPWNQQ